MKHTKVILLFLLTACLLTACCSDDDPLDNGEQTVFDASLLPGCWVMVKDGVLQNSGVWFFDEPYFNSSEYKLAKYWWRKDPSDNLHRCETTSWRILDDGRIDIYMWEGQRTVTKLTRNRLTIASYWLNSPVDIIEYRRMYSYPETIE